MKSIIQNETLDSSMASRKKESEGIALLSIYGDEDDDMDEDMDEPEPEEPAAEEPEKPQNDAEFETLITEDDSDAVNDKNNNNRSSDRMVGFDSANDSTPPISTDNSTPKPFNFGTSSSPRPQQHQVSLSSPPPLPPPPEVASDLNRSRKGTLTIVDYGHDEGALSPEAEEGEIVGVGRVTFGAELQTINGTPSGTVQGLTPNTQATPPQSSEQFDPSLSDAMNYESNELELTELEEAVKITDDEKKDMDPLNKFLPPPPKAKCSDELQEKIIKFISLKKKTGRSFNSEVRNRKEYRNPDFLLHAVTYQDIDQIGSCFNKDVFDPHGYDKSDYYDEIEADLKREMERKEQEKKKSQKVEFLSGGTQSGTVVPTPKITLPIPASGGGQHLVSTAVDAVGRDGRQNKKSKWDKVDVQDSVSSVAAHAALLSAANAGTGYTAFAQQRRREVEERRSSDKKLDRRS